MSRRTLNRVRALSIILLGARFSSNLACRHHGLGAYIWSKIKVAFCSILGGLTSRGRSVYPSEELDGLNKALNDVPAD